VISLSVCIVAYKDLRLNTRVARQARVLAEAGHRVTIICFERPAEASAGIEVLETGLPAMSRAVLAVPRPLRGDFLAHLAAGLGRTRCHDFARRACRLAAGRRFDLIQAHHEKALIAADALRRRCGGKLLFDAIEWPFDPALLPRRPDMLALRRAEMARERAIATNCDGWMTVNDSLAEMAAARFGVPRPLVVRNCRFRTPPGDDGGLRADIGLPPEHKLVLYLNSVRPGEGLEQAVAALARLPGDVHLAVLGPARADYRAALTEQAARTGVAGRFHLLPLQPPSRLIAYAAGADLGIVPRRPEGDNMRFSLPNRVFEMIAARLPLVVSDLPEISRLVTEHRIGIVCDAGDPDAIAAAIRRVLAPESYPTFRRAVAQAAETLTWERESAGYLAFVEALAARDADCLNRPELLASGGADRKA